MAESSVIVIELKAEDRLLLAGCHAAADRATRWRKLCVLADGALLCVWLGLVLAHLFGWL